MGRGRRRDRQAARGTRLHGRHRRPRGGHGGSACEGNVEIARVTALDPDGAATLRRRPMSWEPGNEIEIAITVAPSTEGSVVRVDVHGWGSAVGSGSEVAGWFAGEVVS